MNWKDCTFFVRRMVSYNGTTIYQFGKFVTPPPKPDGYEEAVATLKPELYD